MYVSERGPLRWRWTVPVFKPGWSGLAQTKLANHLKLNKGYIETPGGLTQKGTVLLLVLVSKRQGYGSVKIRRKVPPETERCLSVSVSSCLLVCMLGPGLLGFAFEYGQLCSSEFDPGSRPRGLYHVHPALLHVFLVAQARPIGASGIQRIPVLGHRNKRAIRAVHPDHTLTRQAGAEESTRDVGHVLSFDVAHIARDVGVDVV